ncbi:MAG: hypothetical protein KGJ23_11860 [Euryarchaeota archaeon]|nr:hypothetical protein [Euryarchaeota archaeon]MDE1837291.1 hypothetical protein [Euryarchaeota archaeon]MDE1879961.1 hypothetical protein [Euryarchaeota archaeon]MDE2045104.1 hypothetical protein [Thermoplasmata archaeon]
MSPVEEVPARATLRRACASPQEARALAGAIHPDNADFLRARAEGSVLVLEASSRTVGELQRTLEDALACLSGAERTWAGPGARGRGGPRSSVPPSATTGESDEEADEAS